MNIAAMKELVSSREEIRERVETVDGEEFSIFCYMVASPDLWNVPNAIEARGITFDSDGNIASRTMKKFFNLNENAETQLSQLDFRGALVYDKLDGSMITPVLLSDDTIRVKTKKSFHSDVAIAAQAFLDRPDNTYLVEYIRHWLALGFTPSFEYISPANRIVVDYNGDEQLTLLMMRNNATGQEVDYFDLMSVTNVFGVSLVDATFINSIEAYIEKAKTVEGIEGWVFLLENGQRVKLKTQWYINRHRATSYHARNIFDLVLDEQIDDLMPLFDNNPTALAKVNEVAHTIAHLMKSCEEQTVELVNKWTQQQLTLAEIGQQYNRHPFFSLAIRVFKNQEPDYKQYLINNYRDSFETTSLVFEQ
jgi:T4 RnlA family RNA ligase